MHKTTVLLALTLLLALPGLASADLYFESRTWQEGDNANDAANVTVKGYFEGGNLDLTIEESGNPFMAAGNRLVAKEEEEAKLYLVNDQEQTVSPWDLEAILGMASAVMQGMGPLLNIKIENARVEKLLEQPGGEIVGYDTVHRRHLIEYDIIVKIMGMGSKRHVRTLQDTWSTNKLGQVALGLWLQREPPDFGDSDLQRLIEMQAATQSGYPLKTVIEESQQDKKGRDRGTTRTITLVTALDERPAPPGAYGWPDHYRMVDMMPTEEQLQAGEAGEQEQPDEEEQGKKGWRSKLPFGKKDGG